MLSPNQRDKGETVENKAGAGCGEMMTRASRHQINIEMPPAASILSTRCGASGILLAGRRSSANQLMLLMEVLMTNTISRVAGATLALLILGATYNVSAVQAQKGKATPTLITTSCEMGQVTQCGHTAARTECSRSVTIDFGWLTKTFGWGVGEITCVQIGEKFLYKDFNQGRSSGACMVYSGVGVDALQVRPRNNDEPSDGSDYDDGSCS
ncbi:MAG: hypothetical protein M3Y64_07530 [Gemmatimonadota bacterium]|nr:hypothetical protein [Gemmatimonadota bacterium]